MRTLALDARETAFFREQLTQIQAEVYRETYAELKALKILFADTSISDAVDNYEWRKYSEVGSAKIVSNYATDFPRVDIYGSSEGTKIRSLGTSYGYSVQEIRAAARNGIALESERARVARAAIEKKIDDILWFGDANHGLLGFLNFPGMSEYAIPAGASASRAWTPATAQGQAARATARAASTSAIWAIFSAASSAAGSAADSGGTPTRPSGARASGPACR